MVSKEQFEQRLAELKAQRERDVANLNALVGAIQDCEFWLAQLGKTEGK